MRRSQLKNGVQANGHSPPQDHGVHDTVSKISYTQGSALFPPLLIFISPAFAMILSYTIVQLEGSPQNLVAEIRNDGFLNLLQKAWLPYIFGSRVAWSYIVPFAALQLVLMRALPGKRVQGPVTPAGNTPEYKANGLLAYAVTLVTFSVCAYGFGLFDPADIYDHYLEIIGAMNVVSLVFCAVLCAKGYLLPSSTDSGATGNIPFDYFWGTELYPRILGWDVKLFTNCRFGLMGWPLLIICYAAKQHELYGLSDSMLVSVGLQLIYITKFFHWEMGYMKTLDIMHDRAGFYLCWGCLVWVPSLYTCHTLYLTTHPNSLGLLLATTIFIIGVLAVIINYDADRQKEEVRNSNGNCSIWGRKPDVILATYHTTTGEERTSLLLVSGWWGVSRHFHYIPEITVALCWTLPVLFESPLPYSYLVFLVVLLTHRAVRDDGRCKEKYGRYWDKYCEKVPSKIVPFLF